MKRIICLLLTLALLLTGCGKKEVPPPESPAGPETVRLTVWGAAEDEALMEEMIASFQACYAGEASFSITYQAQGESGCKDALLADLEGGPDVFTFADDQLSALAAAGPWTPWRTRRRSPPPASPPPWRPPAWAARCTPIP